MAIDVSTLTDYSWAQIKLAAKTAMINAALGGSTLTISGRTIGRVTPEQAQALYEFADQQLAAESAGESGLGNVLAIINPES